MARDKLGQWDVKSRTTDEAYKVTQYNDTVLGVTWACSCKRWIFSKAPKPDCKHILGIKNVETTTEQIVPVLSGRKPARAASVREPARPPVIAIKQTVRMIILD